MAEIVFEGTRYPLTQGETVLESLERQGVALASSCRSGICHSCVVRAVSGSVPAAAQKGLRETLRAQGYLLACACRPEEDLELERGQGQRRHEAVLEEVQPLNATVARVRLRCLEDFQYFPGQFVNLAHPEGPIRSYSLASVPAEGFLELHVALLPGGRLSTWLHETAQPGDAVQFLGPQGNCFYVEGQPDQPMFLLGTGTGLAPLYGIVRDALARGHRAPIHLFHGSLRQEGLYLVEDLRRLAGEHEHFHYHPCVLHPPAGHGITVGSVDALALGQLPSLKGWRVFLCGAPDLVQALQRKTFLAGASLREIFADAFLPAAGTGAAQAATVS